MRLQKLLLRYFPPGIGLEYTHHGNIKKKLINLLDLTTSTDIVSLCKVITDVEPIITESVKPQLMSSLAKLQQKLFDDINYTFVYNTTLASHDEPIAQVALNRDGSRCVTASYDNTCKVWDTETGDDTMTLIHSGTVYSVSFNNPYDDRILTASFDRTACVWNAQTGQRLKTLCGHKDEVFFVKFDPLDKLIGTSSMDKTAKIFNIESGIELWSITEHKDIIISLQFSVYGNMIVTGSFDGNIYLWDKRTQKRVMSFEDHKEEIRSCIFNFDSTLVGSGSVDKTARVWDVRNQKCLATLLHDNDVLLVDFDKNGRKLATACSDGITKIFDVSTNNVKLISTLVGHMKDVSKVMFTPGGGLVFTISSDNTGRFWRWETGDCIQVLKGHNDELFDCAISYNGSVVVTGSKDCTCQVYKRSLTSKELNDT